MGEPLDEIPTLMDTIGNAYCKKYKFATQLMNGSLHHIQDVLRDIPEAAEALPDHARLLCITARDRLGDTEGEFFFTLSPTTEGNHKILTKILKKMIFFSLDE